MEFLNYFSKTYEESREQFLSDFEKNKEFWGSASLRSEEILEGLFVDIARFNAHEKKNLLVISSGLHGIEGYVGAAMIRCFSEKFTEKIDTDNTSVIMIHSLNPFGMKNFIHTNEHNVDLNRNFVRNWQNLKENEEYEKARDYLESSCALADPLFNRVDFFFSTIGQLIRSGGEGFKTAVMGGQYAYPNGLYYGGKEYERSTEIMIDLVKTVLKDKYEKIVFIDLRSGLGEKEKMSIVNSALEEKKVAALKQLFDYADIKKTEKEEFYHVSGDMIDYVYHQRRLLVPDKDVYACSFEFGTLGEDFIGLFRSIRNTVNMRKIRRNYVAQSYKSRYIKEYREMFNPSEHIWKMEAVKHFTEALTGILNHFEFTK
ncbi:MAG TPA: M14 family metallopeptidase [Thermotogota bacterium]|nr:M14 family metallopeptidase [Thermotogota bacterium]HPJ88812.1 M14 family metallopeptidase [Thermotogota bacterium]HPR96675.1 M14 family metallopeptidase [Thermotogota bacterium]